MTDYRVVAEYIWLDSNDSFRSKTMVFCCSQNPFEKCKHKSDALWLKEWQYDGSSTGQAKIGNDTEVKLTPVYWCYDPFRINMMQKNPQHAGTLCILVLCENNSNSKSMREYALSSFSKNYDEHPWFGIEQEYYIVDSATNKPLGGDNVRQGEFYCNMGNNRGKHIAEKHLWYCITAELKICGMNAEVGPAQWEYQIGPCVGISAGDELLLSRYIMEKIISETPGIHITWHPKPWRQFNGSGCHTNFSTRLMRENKDAMKYIKNSIEQLGKITHSNNDYYGTDNYLRLTGTHEAPSYKEFTWGVGTRHTSIRIGNQTSNDGRGYYEDRRPGANMNPYWVIAQLNNSTL